MKDKKKEDCPKCPFFNVCAAYIIAEKIEDSRRFGKMIKGEKITDPKRWSEQYCFSDFKNCVHFQLRENAA